MDDPFDVQSKSNIKWIIDSKIDLKWILKIVIHYKKDKISIIEIYLFLNLRLYMADGPFMFRVGCVDTKL